MGLVEQKTILGLFIYWFERVEPYLVNRDNVRKLSLMSLIKFIEKHFEQLLRDL